MDIQDLRDTLGDALYAQVSEKVAGLDGLRLVDTHSGDWIPRARFDEERKAARESQAALEEMRGKLEEADTRFEETGRKHQGQMDKLKGTLREREDRIQSLSGDMETMQHTLESLQGDLKERDGVIASLNREVAEKDAGIQSLRKEQKVRSLVSASGAREQDVVFRLLDMNRIRQEADGSLSGVQEQLDALKKQSAYLFGPAYSPRGGFEGGRETPDRPGPSSRDVNSAIRAAFGR